uniref:G_PROTEIN_RECEP_F1_2 domain-containing protein n=1 Tax=Steinernema glaseri TaxID=37863 RepID=A0A1I7Y875_9BILA
MSLNFNDAIFNFCKYYVSPEDYRNALQEELFTNKIGFAVLSVTPALSVVSLLSNVSMLVLVAIALYRDRLPKRSYSVACSRLASDLLMACTIIGTGISANLHSNTNAIIVIYFVIVTFSFVSISISHLLSIIVRQVSLEPASVYNELVQRRSLVGAIGITWTVAIGYGLAYFPIFRAILSKADVSNGMIEVKEETERSAAALTQSATQKREPAPLSSICGMTNAINRFVILGCKTSRSGICQSQSIAVATCSCFRISLPDGEARLT